MHEDPVYFVVRASGARPRGIAHDARLCRRCRELRGTTLEGWHQPCGCEPVVDDPRAAAHDVARAVELCWACGTVLIGSGSRWSPLHCRWCRRRAVVLNRLAGRVVIPVGRHSLMNGIAVGAAAARDDVAMAAFAVSARTLFGALDAHRKFAARRVAANLRGLGLPADVDVALGDYLAAVSPRREELRAAALAAALGATLGVEIGAAWGPRIEREARAEERRL